MKIDVPYVADVLATVDMDTGEVVKVVVSDTSVRYDGENQGFFTEDGDLVEDWETTRRALKIAEDNIWPEWEVGA